MQELELTWARTLRFWWALFWRGLVISMPLAIVMGFLSGMIVAITGMPNFTTSPWFTIGEMVMLLPLFPVILRMAFRAKYRDFRIVLVPPEGPNAGSGRV